MPMRTRITLKGNAINVKTKLTEKSDVNRLKGALEEAGDLLVEELKDASPKDTGEYANGWTSSVVSTSESGIEINVENNSHPEYPDLPAALNFGHGTGTGGYVPGDNHITSTVKRVKPEIKKLIEGELK